MHMLFFLWPLQQVWDLRKNELAYSVDSHKDIITSIQLSPDGHMLLSNSMVLRIAAIP